ncbi:hypothetical protein F2P79_011171 [Pimephales promelas]|nr:hypothetical protein F2P79_011171 [Pimephales promelas]
MREVGSDEVLNAPCFRNKGEMSSFPFTRDLAFNRGYREVNLVQVSKGQVGELSDGGESGESWLLDLSVSPMMGIYSQVQFGTNNRGRNLAPSLHSSHSNYKLLKRCYSTPAGDNDSTSVPCSSLLLCNGARGATQHRFK